MSSGSSSREETGAVSGFFSKRRWIVFFETYQGFLIRFEVMEAISSKFGNNITRYRSLSPKYRLSFLLPAITGRRFLFSSRLPAARTILPAAAGFSVHILSPERGTDHPPRATDPALNSDCLNRAIEGACPAFHAGWWSVKVYMGHASFKYCMGTDFRAASAVDTTCWIK